MPLVAQTLVLARRCPIMQTIKSFGMVSHLCRWPVQAQHRQQQSKLSPHHPVNVPQPCPIRTTSRGLDTVLLIAVTSNYLGLLNNAN